MDTQHAYKALFNVESNDPVIKNMYVSYITKDGTHHKENFTDEKEFKKFKEHVKNDPDVTDFHASYTEKRIHNEDV